jgi:hypothetical protein
MSRCVALLALVVSVGLFAQEPSAECPTSECAQSARTASPAIAQLWRDASSIHQIKLQFVDAFQRFVRAQAGTFGDEGSELTSAVGAMRESLSRWDRAIAELQARGRRTPGEAEARIVLATVWLDRHRPQAALEDLRAAERVAADRADVHRLRALAQAALDRPQDAAAAIGRASTLEPGNVVNRYVLARYRATACCSAHVSIPAATPRGSRRSSAWVCSDSHRGSRRYSCSHATPRRCRRYEPATMRQLLQRWRMLLRPIRSWRVRRRCGRGSVKPPQC